MSGVRRLDHKRKLKCLSVGTREGRQERRSECIRTLKRLRRPPAAIVSRSFPGLPRAPRGAPSTSQKEARRLEIGRRKPEQSVEQRADVLAEDSERRLRDVAGRTSMRGATHVHMGHICFRLHAVVVFCHSRGSSRAKRRTRSRQADSCKMVREDRGGIT
ncbi:hypothetical protein OBBRIDRAFT_120112 [Obba rivulosa]|uniref:Uncharacterized protein n=1 Tax=Obba rivulosa TaxID=1052685 RepID=A0A8E2AYS5_9APHY|nr:hypothetical protein OBBRIDRAFT_120112 [Obba rivulosa]